MDIPTRVGLGGTALFTLAGVTQPLFGWWFSGPVMMGCAAVAGWGFWPLICNLALPSFGRGIPLHVAARRVYEAAEKADVIDLMLSSSSTPENKLMHFKMLLLVDDRVRLFGAKPPSTKCRLIPKDELQGHDVYPAEGDTSRLDNPYPGDHPPSYVEVTAPRTDLRRIIKIYLDEYVSEAKKLRSGIWS
jgi:hypothetical protein